MADYAISNVPRRVVYAASGVGPYAFTFEILVNTDVAVYKDDALLTLTTDYTVSIASNGTGSITLTASPTGATQIAIVGSRAIQRTTDFVTGGDFFANTVNDEMDSLTIFAQQNAEGLSRALIAPQTDPLNIDMTLPRASVRASKTLAFDTNGRPVVGDLVGDNRGNWAAGTQYRQRDIVKDSSNGNVYYVNVSHTSSGSLPISTNADVAKFDLLVDNASAGASAAAAAASELAAAGHEDAAAASELAAAASESAAASSASAAAASYDSFDDRYLGAKSSNPSVDNDGNALIVGAIYFNTATAQMFVWNGTAWQAQASEAIDFLAERTFTATAGQSSFNFTGGYRDGFTYVWVNGVLLDETEVTFNNPFILIDPPPFGLGLNAGDIVRVLSFKAVGTIGFEDVVGLNDELDLKLNVANPTATGNFTFSGTGNRLIADFSNGTISNRALAQTSEADSSTNFGLLPNGTSTSSSFAAYNAATPTNASSALLSISSTDARLSSARNGSGTYLPLTFYTNNSERVRVDIAGNVGIGMTPDGTSKFQIQTTGGVFSIKGVGLSNLGFDSSGAISYQSEAIDGSHTWLIGGSSKMTLDADGVLDVPGEISVGSLVVADDISSGTGTVVVSGKLSADQISRSFNDAGLNPTAIDLVANYVVQVTISAARTLTTGVPPAGTEAVVIVVSSGATSITVTFGTGFKPSATLATGTTANRRFVLRFISDGTNLIETSRTAAIVY